MPQDGCTSTPKVAGVMSPATPYTNTLLEKYERWQKAQPDNSQKTGKEPTKLMARYKMDKKGQAATQGQHPGKKQTNKANGKRQSGRNLTMLMACYMVK